MSEIPEDVLQSARIALMKIHGATTLGERTEIIARAILAERKRCAGVCAAYRAHFAAYPDCVAKTASANASHIIENAIREPAAAIVFGAS